MPRRTRGTGFCLLNNVAIAVAALRAMARRDRVAIVDWDVHHGDGTQAIFHGDADLLYASTHQYPFYPGTGAAADDGGGAAPQPSARAGEATRPSSPPGATSCCRRSRRSRRRRSSSPPATTPTPPIRSPS